MRFPDSSRYEGEFMQVNFKFQISHHSFSLINVLFARAGSTVMAFIGPSAAGIASRASSGEGGSGGTGCSPLMGEKTGRRGTSR